MALITKPDMSKVWASTGSKTTPPDAKIASGWGYEMMPFEWENWLQNRSDVAITHINQRGIPEWDSVTEYQAARSYTTGSDGVVYIAVTTNTNINPTTDNGTNWKRAFPTTSGLGASGNWSINAIGLYTDNSSPILVTAGSERMRVLSTNGNIGIGDTAPANALVVRRGAGTASYLEVIGNNGVASSLLVGQDATGLSRIHQNGTTPLTFWLNGSERARMTQNSVSFLSTAVTTGNTQTFDIAYNGGNSGSTVVNIGSNNLGPTTTINLNGQTTVGITGLKVDVSQARSDGSTGLDIKSTQTNAFWASVNFKDATQLRASVGMSGAGNGNLEVRQVLAFPLTFHTNNAEVGRFDPSGNFGIGTTSPVSRLHVVGDIQQENATYLKGKTSAGTATRLFGLNASNNLYIGSIDAPAGDTLFVSNGSERMRVSSSGNLFSFGEQVVFDPVVANKDHITYRKQTNFYNYDYHQNNGVTYYTIQTGQIAGWNSNLSSGLSYRWRIGGSDKLVLDSSGNLGVGATPSAWGSAQKAFELPGASSLMTSGSAYASFTQNLYYNGTNWILKAANTGSMYEQSLSGHRWWNAATGAAGSVASMTSVMMIDPSGNLGLNTTPFAWRGSEKAIDIGATASFGYYSGALISNNAYIASSGWLTKVAGRSQKIEITDSGFSFSQSASAAQGATPNWATHFFVNNSGYTAVGNIALDMSSVCNLQASGGVLAPVFETYNSKTVTASVTTTSTASTSLVSVPLAEFRSAEYQIQITSGTAVHTTKIVAMHDGTNVHFSEYGVLKTGTDLGVLSVGISGSNLVLTSTSSTATSTQYKVVATLIKA